MVESIRLKITDGDMLLVHHNDLRTERADMVVNSLKQWFRDRGLSNIEVVRIPTHGHNGIMLTVLSVNDAVEALLK